MNGQRNITVHNEKLAQSLTYPLILAFFVVALPTVLLLILAKSPAINPRWLNPLLATFLLSSSAALSALISYMLQREARVSSHPAVLALAIGFACTSLLFLGGAFLRDPVKLDWLGILSAVWTSLFTAVAVVLIARRSAYRTCRNLLTRNPLKFWLFGPLVFVVFLAISLLYARVELPDQLTVTKIKQWFTLGDLSVISLGLLLAMWLYLRRGASVLLSFALATFLYGLALISRVLGPPWSVLWWYGYALDFASLLLIAYGILEASRLQERMRAEQALRDSEERYRLLFESSPYPLWVYDVETLGILAVNEAAIRQYGYSRSEFLAKTIKDIPPSEDIAALLQDIARNTAEFDPPDLWRHRKKDGTIIYVEVTSHVLNFAGRPAKLVLAHDVTERKKLEQQLRQAQKMEAVGRLAGGVAHDFNNLLGVIIGYSEILEEDIGPSDSLLKKVQEIKKAGQRAASLTRQLLAFSRQQVLTPKVLNLNSVVAEVEKMLGRLIGEDVELTTALDPALAQVKADQGQIEQVIVNLAVNARDAMPQGGKLTIETANVELDDVYTRQHPGSTPGRYVMLAVTDTGCGMDAETQAHIFEPFFTTKELGRGTGLGLATVYGVVKQSGGHIWVYSELEKGTTFKIYLPRVEKAVPVVESRKLPAENLQASETVLLVEDAEPLRRLTRQILESCGYVVLEAATGAEAIQLASQHRGPIHLLLTDLVMPGMSGRALSENLTSTQPHMKVLYMSGYTEFSAGKQEMLGEGAFLLQKPFTRAALIGKVREVVESVSVPASTSLRR